MKLQNISLHLALLLIMISGPLMGAWNAPVIFGLMLLSLFALGLHSLYKVRSHHALNINWLVALPALSVLFTLSMIIPIPAELHAILSPDSSADLQRAYGLLGQHPNTLFLSLAPRETALRFMQLLTALCLFLIISDQVKHQNVQKIIEIWILLGAFLFILVALDHQPLANHNHVARIFGIFSLLCAAYSARHKIFGLAAILSGAAVFTTQSRWGMIAFTLCLLIFLKSWRLNLGILSAGLFIASAIIWDRLATLSDPTTYWSKIEMLKIIPALLKRHWLSGIGQGALSIEYHKNIFPNYDADPIFSYYYWVTYLENTTLQTLVDYGVLKGLILWAIAAWVFILAAKSRPRLAPVFLFVWIGDFSDFAFESGTVLYLCALTLALCPIDLKLSLSPGKLSSLLASFLLFAALASFVAFPQNQVNYLNPAYAYAQPKTEAWLKYTLTRRPTYFQAHVMLARLYWSQHDTNRALSEYSLAIASKPDSLPGLLEEASPIAPMPRVLLPSQSPEALKIWLQFALAHQDSEEALDALQALTNNQPPKDGQTALWFAQILTLQNGLEATIEQTATWGKDLKEPCPFLTWRLQALKPALALQELDGTKQCLDNWEIKKADLYEQNGQPAKALEIIISLTKADPNNEILAARKASLSKRLL